MFETRNTFDFIKDTYYTLGFKAYATGQDSKPPLLDLYISGSAFGTTSVNNFKNVSQFGQKLGVLKTDERNFNWGTITHPFVADNTSTGKLIFLIRSGDFYISDISITATAETGFSPDFMKIKVPMPPVFSERPSEFDFLIEFYDINNNIAETIVVQENQIGRAHV